MAEGGGDSILAALAEVGKTLLQAPWEIAKAAAKVVEKTTGSGK